jgi:hypothetical protein
MGFSSSAVYRAAMNDFTAVDFVYLALAIKR